MENLWRDLRWAARRLLGRRSVAVVAVLCLALGIGAATVVYSLISAVLLRPLPYAGPERLVAIWGEVPRQGGSLPLSDPELLDLREGLEGLEVAGLVPWYFNLTGVDDPERLVGGRITADLFDLVGVEPALGRGFSAEEEAAAAEVVILGHSLWQRRYGGDRELLGGTLSLGGKPYTVVGVMPEGFELLISSIDVWVPWRPRPEAARQRRVALVVGRLGEGTTPAAAAAELESAAAGFAAAHPEVYPPEDAYGLVAKPLKDDLVGDVRPELTVLFAAVGLMLLIACANVANLLLAQAATRGKEVALRAALGAGRGRIVRQLLTESVMLALAGGALGTLAAVWGVRAVRSLELRGVPRLDEMSLDGGVLAFALVLSLATGVLFGLVPALKASRVTLYETLKEGGKTSAAAGHRQPLLAALVVLEVALACVVLVSAGLVMRTFAHLQGLELGFASEGRVTAQLYLPWARYRQNEDLIGFYDRLLAGLRERGELESAAVVSQLPLGPLDDRTQLYLESDPGEAAAGGRSVGLRRISPEYFTTLDVPLLRGRAFDDRDRGDRPPVVVVDAEVAELLWPGREAVGRRLLLSPQSEPRTVVGVVGAIKDRELAERGNETVYVPYAQAPYQVLGVAMETSLEPRAAGAALREVLAEIDPDLPVADVGRYRELIDRTVSRPRFNRLLFGLFGLSTLLLVAVGVYGVMAFSVVERRREMALRTTFGAGRGDLLADVLRRSTAIAGLGVALGSLAAWGLGRVLGETLEGFVRGVAATDLPTFAAVAAGLLLLAVAASLSPALKASRTDPMEVLREE